LNFVNPLYPSFGILNFVNRISCMINSITIMKCKPYMDVDYFWYIKGAILWLTLYRLKFRDITDLVVNPRWTYAVEGVAILTALTRVCFATRHKKKFFNLQKLLFLWNFSFAAPAQDSRAHSRATDQAIAPKDAPHH